ncbi:MAG: methyltransferase [Actinomycetota bacterium]|nr:methyltransferase [Actinomycetota bacterium]
MRIFTVPGVFKPHSDSWMLARAIRERARPGDTVLDPFTGSGVLAIAAAMAGARATAIDISRRAAICAWVNARLNGTRVEVIRADGTAPLGSRRFDWIVANPPYVPGPEVEARGAARAWEAGPDGRRFIDALCREAPHRLEPGGTILLIHSSVCGEEETLRALEAEGLTTQVVTRHEGRLGPLMASRAERLEYLGGADRDSEEMLIFQASRPAAASSG